MRPVNLIPAEQRRSTRGPGAPPPLGVSAVLGGLGVGLLIVIVLVLLSNQVNSKKGELASLTAKQQTAEATSNALRPYGDFAQVQQARATTVKSLARTRFNWERVVRQLSRVVPPDVWLLKFSGTVSAASGTGSGSGGGGGSSSLRSAVQGPAFSLSGCATSQASVARMMARMRAMDGVTRVSTTHSAVATGDSAGGAQGAGSGGAQSSSQDSCTKGRYQFDMLVAMENANVTGLGNGQAPTGPGAAPAAAAQAAGTQSSGTTGASGAGQ